MYKFVHPTPIVIKLTDDLGWGLRQKAADYATTNLNKTGAERGSTEEQGFGVLAEMIVRNQLGMAEISPIGQSPTFDILLPSGVKADVKCRGGSLPFREEYESSDGIMREAKHNLFARQVYDEDLETDIYVLTHLETPKIRSLPGSKRQRKWIIYICGWVSKKRVLREGVYLPRGSLTEQGNTWFPYRGQQVEFYNRNLNGLGKIDDLLSIDKSDVTEDEKKIGEPNLTSVDSIRIAYDLVGRGVLSKEQLDYVIKVANTKKVVKPILHTNQYFHLLNWLQEKGQVSNNQMELAHKVLREQPFSGI